VIAASGRETFALHFDSSDDVGVTTRGFIVRTDLPGAKAPYYLLRGTVRGVRSVETQAGAWQRSPPAGRPVVTVIYYYTPGCRTCEEFLAVEVPKLETGQGVTIALQRRDVLDPAQYEELSAFAALHGQAVREIPALRVGDVLLQGDREIRGRLAAVIAAGAPFTPAAGDGAAAVDNSPAAGRVGAVTDGLSVLPVIAAGLIDGINPCAFTTLIFLLASLALAGRARREVLVIGVVFSFAVFLTYFLIGLGFFAALRAAAAVSVVSVILRWVLVALLVIFAGLSVYDYTLIRRGRPSEMLLQLPSALKKRIHASIRTRVRTVALAGSSLVLGFLVSIFEFACTGQVYLPTLAYLVRVRQQATAVLLLLLYNICFIVPLLAVFGASWLGVSSQRITTVFQAHMGKVKLALAAVFVGLAVFTLVG
jgi:cytochrome c biogenesis protein CcdA